MVNMTGKTKVWPVKSPDRTDIVSWLAVTSSPGGFNLANIYDTFFNPLETLVYMTPFMANEVWLSRMKYSILNL